MAGASTAGINGYVLEPRHVGLKYGPGLNALQWDPVSGRTATQVQRRAQIETLIWIECPRALRWLRTLPKSESVQKSMIATMNELTTELHIENTARELGPKPPESGPGRWEFRTTIYDYSNAQKALEKVQTFVLQSSNAITAAASAPSREILELLDLRVVTDTKGVRRVAQGNPNYARVLPIEKLDTKRVHDGLLTRLIPRWPLTAYQAQLLHELHEIHHEDTQHRLQHGTPGPRSVKAAHRRLEATSRDEDEHSLLRIADFESFVDPTHQADRLAFILQAADRAHHLWADAVMDLDMALAWRFSADHAIWHARRATFDDRLIYRDPTDLGVPVDRALQEP